MKRSAAPGAALLHPLTLAALVTLLVNDHVLKQACPGLLSGKLSDFAGVLLLPLFLHALVELAFARSGRALTPAGSDRWLLGASAVTALVFALPEVWPPAEAAYRYGLGAAQWPFRAAFSLLLGRGAEGLRPVRATADVSDLLALPMLLVAYRVGRRSVPRRRWCRGAPRAALVTGTLLFGLAVPARAFAGSKVPFSREGFYLELEAGTGGGWLDSSGSVSNGFAQEIPSSARGLMLPATGLELGGTLPRLGLVLGGRLGVAVAHEPVVETLGETFRVRDQDLILIDLVAIAEYYPDPRGGLHFGLGLGGAALGTSDSRLGTGFGFSGSLEAGHAFFFSEQWSLGATLRLTCTQTFGRDGRDVSTTFVMPALLATVSYH